MIICEEARAMDCKELLVPRTKNRAEKNPRSIASEEKERERENEDYWKETTVHTGIAP